MRHIDKSKPGGECGIAVFPFVLCLAALFAVGGCGDGETAREAPAARETVQAPLLVSSDPDRRPVITSDVTSLNAWLDLAHAITDGDSLDIGRYEALLATPAYRMIDVETNPDNLGPRFVKRIMDYVFTHRDTTDTAAPRRKSLLNSYLYLRNHLDEVAAINRDLMTTARLDDLRDRLTTYAPAEAWPPEITIEFLAAPPLISFGDPSRFAIDAGLAIAGGAHQTVGLLAGRMYEILAPVDGVKPDNSDDNAVRMAGTFRLLRHGAVSAWLNDKPNIVFDGEHAHLNSAPVGEDAMIENAAQLLDRTAVTLNSMLAPIIEDNIDKFGHRIHSMYGFNDRYEKTGWAMAKLIVVQFGEDRFLEVAGDTPAFLRAYQEAATAGGLDGSLGRMPPFPEDMFEDLLTHLSRY